MRQIAAGMRTLPGRAARGCTSRISPVAARTSDARARPDSQILTTARSPDPGVIRRFTLQQAPCWGRRQPLLTPITPEWGHSRPSLTRGRKQ